MTSLAGKWKAPDGTLYEFTGEGPEFDVRVQGKTQRATGQIVLEGRKGKLRLATASLGNITVDLEVAPDGQSLTVVTMGIPNQFRRA
jgi:hypothetical protein